MKRTNFGRRCAASAGLVVALVGALTWGSSVPATASQTPLRVGILATITLPGGATPFSGYVSGVEARFKAQNNLGGVGGRTIDVVATLDDQGDSTTDIQDQEKLVSSDHVNAVMVESIGFLSSSVLQKAKTLFIGFGVTPGFCDNSATYGFSVEGCGTSTAYGQEANWGGIMKVLPKGAPHTLAIVSENVASTIAGDVTLSTEMTNKGWTVCSIVKTVSPSATDVSPYVSGVTKSCPGGKAPSVIENNANATPVLLTGAEKALGYKGIIVNFITHVPAYLQNAQTATELNGSYDQDYAFGGPENSPAAFAPILSEIKAVGSTYQGLSSTEGWAAADQYIKMLQKVGANSTNEKIEKYFNVGSNGKGNSLPGVAGVYAASSWPVARAEPTPCASEVKIVGKKFLPVMPLTCFNVFKVK
jgi:hypothetical protein